MRRLTVLMMFGALLALPLAAQEEPCSSLEILVDGDTITYTLTGSTPEAPVFLASGETPGETTIDVGRLGSISVGLDRPFAVFPLGETDENGDLSLSVFYPRAGDLVDLYGQTLTLEVTFTVPPPPDGIPLQIDSCESGVVDYIP